MFWSPRSFLYLCSRTLNCYCSSLFLPGVETEHIFELSEAGPSLISQQAARLAGGLLPAVNVLLC